MHRDTIHRVSMYSVTYKKYYVNGKYFPLHGFPCRVLREITEEDKTSYPVYDVKV